MEHWEVALEW